MYGEFNRSRFYIGWGLLRFCGKIRWLGHGGLGSLCGVEVRVRACMLKRSIMGLRVGVSLEGVLDWDRGDGVLGIVLRCNGSWVGSGLQPGVSSQAGCYSP